MGLRCARTPGLLLLLAAALLGCRSADAPETNGDSDQLPRSGGILVVGNISDVDAWNEYVSRSGFANHVLRRIYLRLAEQASRGSEAAGLELVPQLAESWQLAEDGRTLRFRLREARWSDGRPVSARDVAFTHRAATSAEVPWIGADSKARIREVRVIDERTVEYRFDAPYADQIADAAEGGILPEHVFGQVPFAEWPTHDWSSVRVASGPFRLVEHRPGHEIVLERNPLYHRAGHPRVDRVVVRIVPDIGNLVTQLRAGDVDLVIGVPPREASRLRSQQGFSVDAFDYDYAYIGWNGSRPPFDDPELRRAMTLAIDREALVDELLYGFGRVAKSPVLSSWWGADRELTAWPYDPGAAREILARKGFATRGDDGATTGGRTLAFEIITNAGNRLREESLVKIQHQLARVGVEAAVRPVEMGSLRQRAASGDYDAYLGGWVFSGKVDLAALFSSRLLPPEGLNVVFYRSEVVDRELDALAAAPDAAAQLPRYVAIQRRIHEDQPYTFLFEAERVVAAGARVHDLAIELPADPLAGLEELWVAP